jgi:hypothetical protein
MATAAARSDQPAGRVHIMTRPTTVPQTGKHSEVYPTDEQLIGLADLWVGRIRKRGLRNPGLKPQELVDGINKNGMGMSHDGMRCTSAQMLNATEAQLCFVHTPTRKSICRVYTVENIPPMFYDA